MERIINSKHRWISRRFSDPVFSPTNERLNLLLPFPFLVISALEIFLAYPLSGDSQIFSRFITSAFLLNNTHTYFTLAFLLFIPEFGEWLNSHRSHTRWFWLMPSFVFSFFIALFLVFYIGLLPSSLMIPFFVLTILPAVHHGIRQIQGISLLYNRNLERMELSHRQMELLRRSEKWERRFFHVFLLFYSAYILTVTLEASSLTPQGWHLDPYLSIAYSGYAFCLLGILYVNFFVYPLQTLNKFIYLLRLLLFAMVPFCYSAVFGIAAIHGVEYLGVLDLISKNSKVNGAQRLRFYGGTVILSLIGLFLLLFRENDGIAVLFFGSYDSLPTWIYTLAAISLGFTFLHYYLDRIIFTMSRAENREHILPLILRKK